MSEHPINDDELMAVDERLRADAERTGRGAADYYITRGRGRNHYTALGNQVVFEAIRSGLLRQYDHAPD